MFQLFSIFDLTIKKSRSTQDHHFNDFGSIKMLEATYYVSRPSLNWLWRRRFLLVFTIYERGSHLGHVTKPSYMNFSSTSPKSFTFYLVINNPIVFFFEKNFI